MPGLEVWQLAEEARRGRPDLRVRFVTGYMRDERRPESSADLKAPRLGKPFSVSALALKLREVLEKERPVEGMAGAEG